MIDMDATPGFSGWLAEQGLSVLFTSYRAHKVIGIGTNAEGRLTASSCDLLRAMGLGVGDGHLWISARDQLWRFDNFVPGGGRHGEHDAYFVPTESRSTGEIDIHDIALGADGPVFAATRFNCLATLATGHSFAPLWSPPFIDALVPEDRCHLNGFAMDLGHPAYVTCFAPTNTVGGWRNAAEPQGIVLRVPDGQDICGGLSLPHSPRLHRGKLWLHQSGTGELGFVDTTRGSFEPVCQLPGLSRGLAFHDRWAIVGLSEPRDENGFGELPLAQRLSDEGSDAFCGLCLIDTERGEILHQVRVGPDVYEIHDVAILPGVRNPALVTPGSDEGRFAIRPGPNPE